MTKPKLPDYEIHTSAADGRYYLIDRNAIFRVKEMTKENCFDTEAEANAERLKRQSAAIAPLVSGRDEDDNDDGGGGD